jgi:hypothetical protein
MAWLNDVNTNDQTEHDRQAPLFGRALAGAFALLIVVVFSAALLLD